MNIDIIGYIGCFFLFSSFIPQTLNIISEKKYNFITYKFLILIIITSIFMSVYSYLKKIYPVLIANLSVLTNNGVILFLKIYNSKNNITIEPIV
tara:strand:- start:156 stop:437 length:282 start_codon:yes stop_codon:yes gene_type:complete